MTPEGPGLRTGGDEVLVVGAINVDLVVAAPRLPRAGETVVGDGLRRYGGGKGANAAVAAARMGSKVRLIGAVGSDDDGAHALEELGSEGIDVSGVAVLDDAPTGVALVVLDPAGENQIAVGAGANMALTVGQVQGAMMERLPAAGCVLVSTEISGEAVLAAVEAATAAGVPCVLNPAPVIPEVLVALNHHPIVTPNATEGADLAARLLRPVVSDSAAASGQACEAAAVIAAHSRAPVVVTLGGQGALVVAADGTGHHVAARAAIVRDTTGAGDTFNGVLAARIASGRSVEQAVDTAMAAAALSVGHVGAREGMPTAAAIAVQAQAL